MLKKDSHMNGSPSLTIGQNTVPKRKGEGRKCLSQIWSPKPGVIKSTTGCGENKQKTRLSQNTHANKCICFENNISLTLNGPSLSGVTSVSEVVSSILFKASV